MASNEETTDGFEHMVHPTIQVTHLIHKMYEDALHALSTCGERLRLRSGRLVRVTKDATVQDVTVHDVLRALSKGADWLKEGACVAPPRSIAQQVLQQPPDWLPKLSAISRVPYLTPTGSIQSETDTGPVWVALGDTTFPPVPSCPARADAKVALERLAEPFNEFSFSSESDRTTALAMILTGVGLHAFEGYVPAFATIAPLPDSGKTLLIDLISLILDGRNSARLGRPDERQSVFSAIAPMPLLVSFDNVDRVVGGEELERLVTGQGLVERGFKTQRPLVHNWRGILSVNGNCLRFRKPDSMRRFATIELGPRRATFTRDEPELRELVKNERANLVVAALTVLKAYVDAHPGWRSRHRDLTGFSGFEHWSSLIRGALIWLGEVDPLHRRDERLKRYRPTDDELLDHVHAEWVKHFGDDSVLMRDVAKRAAEVPEFHDALSQWVKMKKIDSHSLGYAVREARDKVVSGRRFESPEKKDACGRLWRVATIVAPESASSEAVVQPPQVPIQEPIEPGPADAADHADVPHGFENQAEAVDQQAG